MSEMKVMLSKSNVKMLIKLLIFEVGGQSAGSGGNIQIVRGL